MSEYVQKAQRYAKQVLVFNVRGQEIVRRSAMCPIHTCQVSDFNGVTSEGWVFHCREKGGHKFLAKPDPQAPKTREETEEWLRKQRQRRLTD